jgi:NADPH2 dehydrogenase
MPSPSIPVLFQPIKLGNITLSHGVVLAPMTRQKSSRPAHVLILPLMKEYYSQRSSTPGSLLTTEATLIAAKAGSYQNVPKYGARSEYLRGKR